GAEAATRLGCRGLPRLPRCGCRSHAGRGHGNKRGDNKLAHQLTRNSSKIFPRRINGHRRLRFAAARAVFIGTSDMACAQSTSGSGSEIAAVRSYHHALRRLEIESFAGGEVNTRLWVVIACKFGGPGGLPRKSGAAGADER